MWISLYTELGSDVLILDKFLPWNDSGSYEELHSRAFYKQLERSVSKNSTSNSVTSGILECCKIFKL